MRELIEMIVSKRPEHDKFVLDAIIKSARTNTTLSSMDDQTYYSSFGAKALEMLKDNTTLVMIDDEDSDAWIGFATFSGTCLDYVYVKHQLRRFGFGTALINATGCTTRALDCKPLKRSNCSTLQSLTFDPFKQKKDKR